MTLFIRRFLSSDAQTVSDLIARNFREVNSRDYPGDEIERLAAFYSPDRLLALAAAGHCYVACKGSEIVGTGTVVRSPDNRAECLLQAIFVNPDHHGSKIGHAILHALESDPIALASPRILLFSSITAHHFYKKQGYREVGGSPVLDEHRLYPMEKVREES